MVDDDDDDGDDDDDDDDDDDEIRFCVVYIRGVSYRTIDADIPLKRRRLAAPNSSPWRLRSPSTPRKSRAATSRSASPTSTIVSFLSCVLYTCRRYFNSSIVPLFVSKSKN